MYNPPTEALARMSVEKDSDRYNMAHRHRGKCVIFNHETFDKFHNFAPRNGTQADVRRIEQTFQQFGFTIEICNDYEVNHVMNKIDAREYN